eukprot:COSAG01_NODE_58279_length_307_cov_0.610577_1_plen_21_part_10
MVRCCLFAQVKGSTFRAMADM